MNKQVLVLLLLGLFSFNLFAQVGDTDESSLSSKEDSEDNPKLMYSFVDSTEQSPPKRQLDIQPTLGFGIGMLNYYGEVKSNNSKNPLVGRYGYSVYFSTKLNKYLDLGLHFLTGTLSSDERTVNRNLNFKTKITTAGIYLLHNFGHIYKKERTIKKVLLIS